MSDTQTNDKKVSIIIPNYSTQKNKGKEYILDYLESIKMTKYPNIEIIVVDDASTDDSVDTIKEKHPKIRIVKNPKNIGPTGSLNRGIEVSTGDYLFFSDNDMLVHDPNWLDELVNTADSDHTIGVVIPERIYFYDRNVIQTETMAYRQTIENQKKFRASKLIYKILGAPILVTGVCLIKREALDKVGKFDEDVFGEFGDADMHYRIVRAGYKSVFEPKSKMLHKGKKLNPKEIRESSPSKSWRKKYYFAGKLRFILKNYDPPLMFLTLATNLAYYMFLIVYFAVRNRPDLSRAVRDGIMWNIKNWRHYI